jgi:hypothetical protein
MGALISPEAVMAMEILNADRQGRKLEIEDISKQFVDLQGQQIPIREVALRTVPTGVYSEDVEAFIGRLLAVGYARARSPIEFHGDGLRICRNIIAGENRRIPDDIRRLAEVMRFDLATVTNPAP